jgi:uncharacterized membrane protein YccF (DUF307 family)
MRTGLNILWFILGGAVAALCWYLAAAVMALSIIGLPWARGCWEIGTMNLHPFGRDIVSVDELSGRAGAGDVLGLIANLLWLPLGILLAVLHVLHGVALCCTIIGIPFGLQGFKLAAICLAPVGKRVVLREVAEAARRHGAWARLASYRSPRAST